MYKIIGGDQKEYGPVSLEELRRWIAEGRANSQTSVRAQGATEWKPLSAFPEFTDALRAQGVPPPLTDPQVSPAATAAWSQQILTRYSEIGIGRCLANSWRLLMGNFGLLFGATFLVWLIGTFCEFVPFGIGKLAYWIFQGVFYGGVYLVFLKRIRGEPAAVSDAFSGFRGQLAQLLLAGVVSSLLSGIGWGFCLVPGLYLFIAWVFAVPLVADNHLEFWSAMELSRKVVTRVWFEMFGLMLIAFLPFLLVNLFVGIKVFTLMFAATRDIFSANTIDPGRLVRLILQIAAAVVPLALLTKLVLLLNLPLATGALMYAYEDLFGTRPPPAP